MPVKKRESLPIYTSIDQFHNLKEISSRSNSSVYEALCHATGISVAIKRFKKDSLSAKEAVHVAREVHLMSMLRGEPGIVQIYGFFEDDTHAYIVMEHCSGCDLYQFFITKGRTMDESYVATTILAPLLNTLNKLHAHHNIIHRDIKPENILLTAHGEIRLADFGTAIKQDVEVPFLPVGTLDFMAPEVFDNPTPKGAVESPCTTPDMLYEAGLQPYDEKADIWSVGALAYELMIGEPPFYHENAEETKKLILGSAYLYFPRRFKASPFARFVCSAMTRDPSMRPSAADLLKHEWILNHCNISTIDEDHIMTVDQGNTDDAIQKSSSLTVDPIQIHATSSSASTASAITTINTTNTRTPPAVIQSTTTTTMNANPIRRDTSKQRLTGSKHPHPNSSMSRQLKSIAMETLAALAMIQLKDGNTTNSNTTTGTASPTKNNNDSGSETGLSRTASINGVLQMHNVLSDDSGDVEQPPPRKVSRLSYSTSDEPGQRSSLFVGVNDDGSGLMQQSSSVGKRLSLSMQQQQGGRNWLKKFSIRRASRR